MSSELRAFLSNAGLDSMWSFLVDECGIERTADLDSLDIDDLVGLGAEHDMSVKLLQALGKDASSRPQAAAYSAPPPPQPAAYAAPPVASTQDDAADTAASKAWPDMPDEQAATPAASASTTASGCSSPRSVGLLT